MTLTQIEYVLALNECRNFTKAASLCHITQPTLSMQIQKLEEELDVILFDRTKNPILPTKAGSTFIKKAKKLMADVKSLQDEVKLDDQKIEGEFILGIIPTIAPYIIPLFIDQFSKDYPLVQLVLKEMKTEDITESIENDKIDGAILATPLNISQLIERPLYYEEFCLFAAKTHPLLLKETITEKDLKNQVLWPLNEGHCLRDQMNALCKIKQDKPVYQNVAFASDSIEAIKNLIIAGNGATILPKSSVETLPQLYKKQIRYFSGKKPVREVSLIHSRVFLKERIIEALEKTIVNSLPEYLDSPKTKTIKVIPIN